MAHSFMEPYATLYNNAPRKNVGPGKRQVADFEFKHTLGEGSFATVMLVEERSNGYKYAMKILEKAHIMKENKVNTVKRERDIISQLSHPYVIQLYCTFQTETHLFFALTLASNGCLLDLLLKYGSFSRRTTQFYTAELVLVLEYLHSKGVIHRDFKPENILLNKQWHILLTDFGTAAQLSEDNQRPKSFVGTAQYVSPELLSDKYTCKESDIWALGCVLYQCIAGTSPFDGAQHEYGIFQKVKHLEYSFEEGFPETEKDCVEKILKTKPEERLGSDARGGIKELKEHPMFEGIDWETLPTTTPPTITPFLPQTSIDNSDTQVVFEDNGVLEKAVFEGFDSLNITAPKKLNNNRQSALSSQAQGKPKLHKHCNGNELIMMDGLCYKRRGLSKKKRHLILTDYPSLYYIDPVTQQLKGQVPWESGLEVQCKSKKLFLIHTPNRVYYLECCEGNASGWCDKINEVKELLKTRGGAADLT